MFKFEEDRRSLKCIYWMMGFKRWDLRRWWDARVTGLSSPTPLRISVSHLINAVLQLFVVRALQVIEIDGIGLLATSATTSCLSAKRNFYILFGPGQMYTISMILIKTILYFHKKSKDRKTNFFGQLHYYLSRPRLFL